MKIILKILFFLLTVFHTNIVEAKFIVFNRVVSEVKFIVDDIKSKNKSTVISENGFGICCKSENNLVDYREWGAGVEAVAAKTGITVLGHYPQYVKVAETIGARTFQIPTKIWNKMTPAQQWEANQKFLDRMILRGDNIRLATPLNQVKPGSFYQKELNYLFDKGYKVSSDGLWLVK